MTVSGIVLPDPEQLTAFLVSLHGRGFKIAPGQIAACQRLLLDAHAVGTESGGAGRLKFRLAPVIARSEEQQREFYDLVDELLFRSINDRTVPLRPEGGDRDRTAIVQEPSLRSVSFRAGKWITVAAVLVAVLFVAGLWLFGKSPEPIATSSSEPAPQATSAAKARDLPQDDITIHETLISPTYPVVKWALALLPISLFAIWQGWRWRRRMLWIDFGYGHINAARALALPPDLFQSLYHGTTLRRNAANLRMSGAGPTDRFDIQASVDETAREAGLFTPIYQELRPLPEYMFLIEQAGTHDHLARMFDLMVDRLRWEHIVIERYYFRSDPRVLQRDDRQRSDLTLHELAARTSGHRLFVLGTADGCFHPLTGEVENWVTSLSPWRSRTILSIRPLRYWGLTELRLLEQGFSIATARASGLAAAARQVSREDSPAVWLERPPRITVPVRKPIRAWGQQAELDVDAGLDLVRQVLIAQIRRRGPVRTQHRSEMNDITSEEVNETLSVIRQQLVKQIANRSISLSGGQRVHETGVNIINDSSGWLDDQPTIKLRRNRNVAISAEIYDGSDDQPTVKLKRNRRHEQSDSVSGQLTVLRQILVRQISQHAGLTAGEPVRPIRRGWWRRE